MIEKSIFRDVTKLSDDVIKKLLLSRNYCCQEVNVVEKIMLSRSVDLEKRVVVVIIAPHRREKKTDWTKYQKALQSLLVLRSLIFFIILSLLVLRSLIFFIILSLLVLRSLIFFIILDSILSSLILLHHPCLWCMYHYVTCWNIMYTPKYDAFITMFHVEI